MLDLLPEWRAANTSLDNALVLDGDWIPADEGGVSNALPEPPNPALATLAKSPYFRRLHTSFPNITQLEMASSNCEATGLVI